MDDGSFATLEPVVDYYSRGENSNPGARSRDPANQSEYRREARPCLISERVDRGKPRQGVKRLLQPVLDSLRRVGIDSAVDLLATHTTLGSDLGPWLRDGVIDGDRELRLQSLAGLGLNVDANRAIYLEMLWSSTFPSAVFVGSPATVQPLQVVTERNRPEAES